MADKKESRGNSRFTMAKRTANKRSTSEDEISATPTKAKPTRPGAEALLRGPTVKAPAPLAKAEPRVPRREIPLGLNFTEEEYQTIKKEMLEKSPDKLQLGWYVRQKMFELDEEKFIVYEPEEKGRQSKNGGRNRRIGLALDPDEYDMIKKKMLETDWTLQISVYARCVAYRAFPGITPNR